jgi:1-deoxyxylulose-5-phosphate synthase
MEHVRFGNTGLKVSRLCLGTMSLGSSHWKPWVLDEDRAVPILRRALDRGIRFFDMADWYSTGRNEELVGRRLLEWLPRQELVLATKVFYPMSEQPNDRGLSRKHLLTSIDRSLRRLGTDYVDLYIVHAFDADTPIEETLATLHEIVQAGKARYLGASTMYAWQLAKMNYTARLNGWTSFVNMQCQYSLLYREEEREMMPFCASEGIAVIPWSPMARGYLAGSGVGEGASTVRGRTDPFSVTLGLGSRQDEAIRKRVIETAEKLNIKPAVVALAWVLSKPFITAPIVGASKPHHLADAVAATELKLDARTIAKLEEPYHPKAVAGHM